jgi:hypothetical protein
LRRALTEAEYLRLADMTCALPSNIGLLQDIGRQAGQSYLQDVSPPVGFDPW